MRIVVITDVHANLPALEAVLESIRSEGYDAVFHTGDAIAIGPYPSECVDLLLSIPDLQCVMGNHEAYFVDGLPSPQPEWMSDGEVAHQHWTHARLDLAVRPVLAQWPYVLSHSFEGVKATFVHYGLAPPSDFRRVVRDVTASRLDTVFASYDADVIFYGHDHRASDVQGRARYVNPGSLGCHNQAIARYCVATCHGGECTVEHRSVPYDDAELIRAFERRDVPERVFIYRAFFGGRFGAE